MIHFLEGVPNLRPAREMLVRRIMLFMGVAMVICYAVLSVAHDTSLFGDGSSILAQNIGEGFSLSYLEEARAHPALLNKLFVNLGFLLGVSSPFLMVKLHTVGCVFWTSLFFLLSFAVCYRKKDGYKLGITLICAGMVLIFTGLFAYMETISGAALFWLMFLVNLEYGNQERTGSKIGYTMLSLLALRYHQYFAAFSLVLVLMLLLRVAKGRVRMDAYLWVNMLLWIATAGYQAWFILFPRDAANRSALLRALLILDEDLLMAVGLIVLALVLSLFAYRKGGGKQSSRAEAGRRNMVAMAAAAAVQAILIFLLLRLVASQSHAVSQRSYVSRIMNLFLPLGLALWIILADFFNLHVPHNCLAASAAGIAAVSILFSFSSTAGYERYLEGLAGVCAENKGYVLSSGHEETRSPFYFGWTIPGESIFAQIMHNGASRINSAFVMPKAEIAWEPYDSHDIRQYPDLSRCGVTYDEAGFAADGAAPERPGP